MGCVAPRLPYHGRRLRSVSTQLVVHTREQEVTIDNKILRLSLIHCVLLLPTVTGYQFVPGKRASEQKNRTRSKITNEGRSRVSGSDNRVRPKSIIDVIQQMSYLYGHNLNRCDRQRSLFPHAEHITIQICLPRPILFTRLSHLLFQSFCWITI